jgi:CheY-like chemotaxis protein
VPAPPPNARVLIVEDEVIVSMLLEDMLAELGYAVIGPATRIDSALAMAETAALEAAVLDVNLNGRTTYPVAEALSRRAIPFVLSTGYGIGELGERFRGTPVLQKPFQRDDLARALSIVMPQAGAGRA